jgi:hypothetical protein
MTADRAREGTRPRAPVPDYSELFGNGRAPRVRAKAPFIPHCPLEPIPSLLGTPAGAGASAADGIFLNQHIAALLKGEPLRH